MSPFWILLIDSVWLWTMLTLVVVFTGDGENTVSTIAFSMILWLCMFSGAFVAYRLHDLPYQLASDTAGFAVATVLFVLFVQLHGRIADLD
ncbi:MAG: hypothetical protein HKM24_07585 [Gammaproteobacteria bacterium]|nr:hypothetical protein [Gammaproteobacteria bacterium]